MIGHSVAEAADGRRNAAHPVSTLASAVLAGITAWVACRLFGDDSLLAPWLAALAALHSVALVLRLTRIHAAVAAAATGVVAAALIGVLHYRSTLWTFLPTRTTLDQFLTDVRLVAEQFPTAVAPVPTTGPFAALATTMLLLVTAVGEWMAARSRSALNAIVPTGAFVVLVAAVGTERAAVSSTSTWLAAAAGAVAVIRSARTRSDAHWLDGRRPLVATLLPGVLGVALLAGASAAALGPRLPGAGEPAWIDARHRNGDTTRVLNPLVDIRAEMTNRGNLEMFSVQSGGGGHYWRSMGLPVFDGTTFSPAAGTLEPLGDRRGASLPNVRSTVVSQLLTVSGLRGNIVPAAAFPVRVSPDLVWWSPDTQGLVVPDIELDTGDQVFVESALVYPETTMLDGLGHAGAPEGTLDLPSIPSTARELALDVTSAAPTSYEKLLALQGWFRSEFEYDLSVQLGDSDGAMEVFLRDRRGFCQQFAVTFAAMARSLGIPAQVAVGFTQGDLESDGQFHVYGRHAHAWAEVWFDGLGWVAFDPTPGRGNPDATDWTFVDAAQDDSGGRPTGAGTSSGTPTPTSTPTLPSVPREDIGVTSTTVATSPGSGTTGGTLTSPDDGTEEMPLAIKIGLASVAGLVLALGAWAALMPVAVTAFARMRRSGDAAERIASLWHRARRDLADAGAPDSEALTPLQFARAAELSTGVDHRALRDMALLVTEATYAPTPVDAAVVRRCVRLADDLRAMSRPGVPARTKWRNRVSPRAAAARAAR